jgi:hypothetical protein
MPMRAFTPAACASCHYNRDNARLAARPDLALNSAVHLPDPVTLIQVTLRAGSAVINELCSASDIRMGLH